MRISNNPAKMLQTNFKETAGISNVPESANINSERVEKAEEVGKFKVISVTVDAVFPDIRALSDTLVTIETQTPYLVVREVDVRVRNYTDPKDLIVKLKVAALAGQ